MNSRNLLFIFAVFIQITAYSCTPFWGKVKMGESGDENRKISLLSRNYVGRTCRCKGWLFNYDPCDCPRNVPYCPSACFNREVRRGQPGYIYHCSSTCVGCFPATARVSLENGKSVTMSELQIGDRVQTASSGDDASYSEIRTFLQKQPNVLTDYTSITTLWNSTISMSGKHLIYARKISTSKFYPIYASQVSVGEEVLVQGNNGLIPDKVINVSIFTMQGAYVPLTMEGNIVVDGVLASTYVSVDHDLAHFGMTPIRWFPQTTEWIFGKVNGLSGYVQLAKHFGTWLLSDM